MSKPAELREQTDEQLELLLKEVQHNLFRLRLQSETERLEAPSEIVKAKREIARIKTILRLREIERRAVGSGRDRNVTDRSRAIAHRVRTARSQSQNNRMITTREKPDESEQARPVTRRRRPVPAARRRSGS